MHHRHFALFFIPLLCFALVVGSAHGSPFPRCKKASSRCVGFVIGFIVGFYIMIYAAWCLCLCAYGFVEMCRYFRKRRKTIPYNENSFGRSRLRNGRRPQAKSIVPGGPAM